jgi:hypothetical protein
VVAHTSALLLLDRVLSIDSVPFRLVDLAAHAILLAGMADNTVPTAPDLRIEPLWRGLAVAAPSLWELAQTQLPYPCLGVRFETVGAPSPASDRVWLAPHATRRPDHPLVPAATTPA